MVSRKLSSHVVHPVFSPPVLRVGAFCCDGSCIMRRSVLRGLGLLDGVAVEIEDEDEDEDGMGDVTWLEIFHACTPAPAGSGDRELARDSHIWFQHRTTQVALAN